MGFDLNTDTLIAVISAVGIGLTFCVVGLLLAGRAGGRVFQRRLNSMQERAQGIATSEWAAARSLSRQQSATRLDRIAGNWLPRRDLLLARLERTGRTISIGKYAMTAIGLGALSAIAVASGTGIGIVPSLVIGLLIGAAVPHLVIGRMGKRRLARFINLFPDAIDLVVRALRSGLPVTEAIVGAGHEIADPVGAELRLVESGMRMGRDLESLLWETAKRIDAPEFRFFVIALSVQRETGGNLAETLSNLADILRRRKQMNLNPAVGLETGTGFAAACNQGERLKPVRGAAADRAGGPLGSVSALRSGCDTTVAPGPTAPQFLATAPGSRQSVGRRGVPCVGRRACC